MDLGRALDWSPPEGWVGLDVIESHTGGEPFRVVIRGIGDIPGDTVLAKRRHAMSHLDDLRKALMWEPRGHADMYGCWVGEPVEPDSHLSVLFMHNEGFSTMCGHGIIALTKVALETGIVDAVGPDQELRIDTPAGTVSARAETLEGRVGRVRFRNVLSFAAGLDEHVEVPGLGDVVYDLAFGGAFYAYVDAAAAGVDLDDPAGLIEAGRLIKGAVSAARVIDHPEDEGDLGFLYGVIFTAPALNAGNHGRNVCVFADGEIDRSPTGTGVSGRLAILHARGEIGDEEEISVESIVGSVFTGRVAGTGRVGPYDAVVPEIGGEAHIVGRSTLWIDPGDPLNPGFFLR